MSRLLVGAGLLVWVGASLILSASGRLTRPSLADRLRPFHPGPVPMARRAAPLSARSLADILLPVVRVWGDRLAAVLGATERADVRLRRIHSTRRASVFRLQQSAWSAAAMVAGATVAAATRAPVGVDLLLVLGAPLLAFLVVEQWLARQSEAWQRSVELEMPVVAEQMAILLNAGFSLGAALGRLATRGHGCVTRDLQRVVNRIQQGLTEAQALQEWADLARSEGVARIVAVLTLHSSSGDLGRLVSAEARQSRRDLHRRTIELMERRAQQVWVPVTVATLVPGAILLAVPFLSALQLFAGS